MQKEKIYNTFEFVANLSIPKETEKFKPYSKTEYDSKWVNEELKLNAKIPESSELVTIKDGYFNKSDYSFEKQGVDKKKDGVVVSKGSRIKVSWKDRKNKTILDKIVNYQKFILDTSNNKERYDLRQAIQKLNDDAISEEDINKIKKQFELISGLEKINEIKSTLEEELIRLEGLRKEYLSRVDMIADIKKLMNTSEGTNTIFKITGDITHYQKKNGETGRNFEVKRIEKATDKEKQKLKLNGHLDLYFNSNSIDDSLFELKKKYILNAWTKTYDSQLKQQIYLPITLVADGSRLDLNNEKHVKRLNGLIKPFKFDIEGKEKDIEKIYELQFEVKFARGAEKVELTMDDLSDEVKEYIEDGIMSFEDAVLELGGDKFGDRIDETRLFKPNVKDFDKGAVDTDLTLEDLCIDKEAKLKEKQNAESDSVDSSEEIEEDIDDLI